MIYYEYSSVIFQNVWISSENVQKGLPRLGTNFGKSLEIYGEGSEIFAKSSKISLCILKILCYKKKIAWLLQDMKFHMKFEIFHLFVALTIEIFFNTL